MAEEEVKKRSRPKSIASVEYLSTKMQKARNFFQSQEKLKVPKEKKQEKLDIPGEKKKTKKRKFFRSPSFLKRKTKYHSALDLREAVCNDAFEENPERGSAHLLRDGRKRYSLGKGMYWYSEYPSSTDVSEAGDTLDEESENGSTINVLDIDETIDEEMELQKDLNESSYEPRKEYSDTKCLVEGNKKDKSEIDNENDHILQSRYSKKSHPASERKCIVDTTLTTAQIVQQKQMSESEDVGNNTDGQQRNFSDDFTEGSNMNTTDACKVDQSNRVTADNVEGIHRYEDSALKCGRENIKDKRRRFSDDFTDKTVMDQAKDVTQDEQKNCDKDSSRTGNIIGTIDNAIDNTTRFSEDCLAKIVDKKGKEISCVDRRTGDKDQSEAEHVENNNGDNRRFSDDFSIRTIDREFSDAYSGEEDYREDASRKLSDDSTLRNISSERENVAENTKMIDNDNLFDETIHTENGDKARKFSDDFTEKAISVQTNDTPQSEKRVSSEASYETVNNAISDTDERRIFSNDALEEGFKINSNNNDNESECGTNEKGRKYIDDLTSKYTPNNRRRKNMLSNDFYHAEDTASESIDHCEKDRDSNADIYGEVLTSKFILHNLFAASNDATKRFSSDFTTLMDYENSYDKIFCNESTATSVDSDRRQNRIVDEGKKFLDCSSQHTANDHKDSGIEDTPGDTKENSEKNLYKKTRQTFDLPKKSDNYTTKERTGNPTGDASHPVKMRSKTDEPSSKISSNTSNSREDMGARDSNGSPFDINLTNQNDLNVQVDNYSIISNQRITMETDKESTAEFEKTICNEQIVSGENDSDKLTQDVEHAISDIGDKVNTESIESDIKQMNQFSNFKHLRTSSIEFSQNDLGETENTSPGCHLDEVVGNEKNESKIVISTNTFIQEEQCEEFEETECQQMPDEITDTYFRYINSEAPDSKAKELVHHQTHDHNLNLNSPAQEHIVKPSNKSQDHNLDTSSQAQDHILRPSNKTQGHNIDTSSQARDHILEPSNKSQDHNLDTSSQAQDHIIRPSNKIQGHNIDTSSQARDHILESSNKTQGHNIDTSSQARDHILEPSNKSQDHNLDTSSQAQDHILGPSNKTQDHNLDTSRQTQDYILEPSNKTQGHNNDTSSQARYQIFEPSNKSQDHNLDTSSQAQDHILKPSNKTQDHNLDTSSQTQDHILKPSNKTQSSNLHTSSQTQDYILEPSNKTQDHNIDTSSQTQDYIHQPSNKTQDHNLDTSSQIQDHILEPSNKTPDHTLDPSIETHDHKHDQNIQTHNHNSDHITENEKTVSLSNALDVNILQNDVPSMDLNIPDLQEDALDTSLSSWSSISSISSLSPCPDDETDDFFHGCLNENVHANIVWEEKTLSDMCPYASQLNTHKSKNQSLEHLISEKDLDYSLECYSAMEHKPGNLGTNSSGFDPNDGILDRCPMSLDDISRSSGDGQEQSEEEIISGTLGSISQKLQQKQSADEESKLSDEDINGSITGPRLAESSFISSKQMESIEIGTKILSHDVYTNGNNKLSGCNVIKEEEKMTKPSSEPSGAVHSNESDIYKISPSDNPSSGKQFELDLADLYGLVDDETSKNDEDDFEDEVFQILKETLEKPETNDNSESEVGYSSDSSQDSLHPTTLVSFHHTRRRLRPEVPKHRISRYDSIQAFKRLGALQPEVDILGKNEISSKLRKQSSTTFTSLCRSFNDSISSGQRSSSVENQYLISATEQRKSSEANSQVLEDEVFTMPEEQKDSVDKTDRSTKLMSRLSSLFCELGGRLRPIIKKVVEGKYCQMFEMMFWIPLLIMGIYIIFVESGTLFEGSLSCVE